MTALFVIPLLFFSFTDIGLINIFHSNSRSAQDITSSKQQSCMYYERFTRREHNKYEEVANQIKSRNIDSDFVYCTNSFKKAIGFEYESILNKNFFKRVKSSLQKDKNYKVQVWTQEKKLAKKLATKLEIQLFKAGYNVFQSGYHPIKGSKREIPCTNTNISEDYIHILYSDKKTPKLGICSVKGWKWI